MKWRSWRGKHRNTFLLVQLHDCHPWFQLEGAPGSAGRIVGANQWQMFRDFSVAMPWCRDASNSFFGGANPDPSQLDGLLFQISPETLVCLLLGCIGAEKLGMLRRELETTHGHVSTFTNCGWLHLSVPTLLTATFCPSTWRPLLKIGETWVNE